MKGARSGKQLQLFGAARAKTTAKPGTKRRRRNGVRPGPKPRVERLGFVEHVARPEHVARHPVHVSMKRVPRAPSFRAERVFAAIRAQIAACVARGVRVVHYSVQHDHLHLLVEADDKKKLARGLQLLFSRIAFAVNAVARRHGSLFRDRHHRRDLTTPTETRRVLVYLFFNTRKHDLQHFCATSATFDLDAMSSAPWFSGWHELARPPPEALERARAQCSTPPVAPARTWLAGSGWRRAGGPIGWHEIPKFQGETQLRRTYLDEAGRTRRRRRARTSAALVRSRRRESRKFRLDASERRLSHVELGSRRRRSS